jgi:hypothetical protein
MSTRFWSNVQKQPGDGCWLWTRAKDRDGYGLLHWNGRTQRAHHVAWELETGSSPPNGIVIQHRCDTPSCVRFSHFIPGTHGTNVADKVAKQRQTKGEAIPQSKLTENDVIVIRMMARAGHGVRALAERYGLTEQQVRNIVDRRQWKHVP